MLDKITVLQCVWVFSNHCTSTIPSNEETSYHDELGTQIGTYNYVCHQQNVCSYLEMPHQSDTSVATILS